MTDQTSKRTDPNFGVFFLILSADEGRENPNTTKSGPASARQRNGVLLASR